MDHYTRSSIHIAIFSKFSLTLIEPIWKYEFLQKSKYLFFDYCPPPKIWFYYKNAIISNAKYHVGKEVDENLHPVRAFYFVAALKFPPCMYSIHDSVEQATHSTTACIFEFALKCIHWTIQKTLETTHYLKVRGSFPSGLPLFWTSRMNKTLIP